MNASNILKYYHLFSYIIASIGGLFGALSIIITGFLLYGVFTAKQEDKWYYITAVLLNIGLLLLLMIGAIIFDKIYLKKWARIPSRQQQQMPVIRNDIDHSITNQCDSATPFNCPSIMADIPPEYPGYFRDTILFNQQPFILNESSNPNNIVLIAADNNDLILNLTTTTASRTKEVNDDIQLNLPPHYTDLYPNIIVKNDAAGKAENY